MTLLDGLPKPERTWAFITIALALTIRRQAALAKATGPSANEAPQAFWQTASRPRDLISSFLSAEFSTDEDCRRRVEKLHAMEAQD